jgi:hypothetical protein
VAEINQPGANGGGQPLAPARGILLAVLVSSVLWVGLAISLVAG